MKRLTTLTGLTTALLLFGAGCGGDGGDDETEPDESLPPPPSIDLLADSNRDGVVDDLDTDELEFPWSVAGGAVFLPNLDDDNLDGLRDAETGWIDVVPGVNDADAFDLAPLDVRAWPDAPDGAVALVQLDLGSMPYVQVHRFYPDGIECGPGVTCYWVPVIDANAPCDPNFEWSICDNMIFLTAADIKAGVRFGVEGKTLIGLPDSVGWTGIAQFDYAVFEYNGSTEPMADEANPDGWDHVQMRVSSWQMYGNHTPGIDVAMSDDVSPAFVQGIQVATDDAGIYFNVIQDYQDRWVEDWLVTGWVSMPYPDGQVHGMRLAYPRPHSQEASNRLPVEWLQSPSWLGVDQGYLVTYASPTASTYNSGGNHDLIPPYENTANGQSYPVGRFIHGSFVLQSTQDFYAAQSPQAPTLIVPTDWLIVGHVDEALSYLPANTERGWKLAIGSPNLAVSMLQDWSTQGHGAVEMFVGKQFWNGTSAATGIDEALGEENLMAWSQQGQANIDVMVDMVVAEVGLTADELIEYPLLFESEGGGLVAWNPGTVNSRVWGQHIVVPDPFGPSINGVDGFKQDLIDRLGTPAHGLGADGQGLNVFFTDNWSAYHINLGEVHCGTNFSGPAPASEKWWEAAQ